MSFKLKYFGKFIHIYLTKVLKNLLSRDNRSKKASIEPNSEVIFLLHISLMPLRKFSKIFYVSVSIVLFFQMQIASELIRFDQHQLSQH